MKRLLCILMVMMMAVLLVPTMAVADDVGDIIVISPSAAKTAGCIAKGTIHTESDMTACYVTGWDLMATPAKGWTFVMWKVTGWKGASTCTSP